MATTELTSRSTAPGSEFVVPEQQGLTRAGKQRRDSIFGHTMLIVLSVIFAFPFLWMLTTAIKPESQIFAFPPEFVPESTVWSNFPDAMTFVPFGTYIVNTLIVCLFSVAGTLISSSLVAYGFAKIRWPGRNIVFVIMLSTLMLPYQVVMIPLFTLFAQLNWIGTYLPLIVPSFFGSAFYIFLLRQFFLTIPNDLSDSARLDGATEVRIFWQIMLPLAKPALATVALLTFIGGWNEFLQPLIYLNDDTMYTVSLGLQQFVGQYGTRWGMLMAASIVATLPILVLFFLAQRTFVAGISTTGLKG